MTRVLLTHALRWPNVARLARAFHDVGANVSVLARAGHPVHEIAAVSRSFVYRTYAPHEGLRRAIESVGPDLIVPCDDRALEAMRGLRESAGGALAESIDRSLGAAVAAGEGAERAALVEYGRLPGVLTPAMAQVNTLAELRDFVAEVGGPVVLKLDGSYGGRDVLVVESGPSLLRGFARMRLRRGPTWRMKRLLVNGDFEAFFVRRWKKRGVTAQAYIDGEPANIALACWRGEVIAQVAVKALMTNSRFGVATVVEPLRHEGMLAAARAVSRKLNLSGVHGLDFILDAEGRAHLIEINARATQTAHLPLGPGQDIPGALIAAMGAQKPLPRPEIAAPEIALFPQEWMRDRESPWLSRAYHDTPLEDPALLVHYGYALERARAERAPFSATNDELPQIPHLTTSLCYNNAK